MSKSAFVGIGAVIIIAIGILFFAQSFKKEDNNVTTTSSPSSLSLAKQEGTTSPTLMQQKSYTEPPPTLAASQIKGKTATIKTDKGDIVFELFDDAPKASSNFIFLANDKFYNGLTFHRREEGFVIQGGDPNGTGTGGPGYSFADEKVTRDYDRGIVAMANSGPNTNGSQFFIMLKDTPLPKNYTIFGKVIQGMDVVDKIQVGDKMNLVTIEQ
jgi:cyclophilin family peptidyl-prolyl cis-trans isomerase